LLAAVAGCSGADGSGDESSESLPWQAESSSTAEADLTPDEAAMAAIEDYWRVIDEAAAIPDPNYEALSEVSQEQAFDGAVAMVQEQLDDGTRVDGGITLSGTTVVERTPEDQPTEIVVETCVDNSTAVIVDAASGVPVDDATYGRRQARAVVLLGDHGWYVRAINTEEIGSC
jgi:regulator of extracellular matrix RemA (YlzA/DUF370 family)